ncbi:transcription factor GTE7 isoform X2 [Daucus carota subsp. sativus]|uniref:transcription factor GTE7 isoform X2 n=1 Tax=Daucus carota subsp. sativus TaxID=79200 RepID=UPI0007EFE568|nr:PREDICTED: transcription factor GTE7-like isoform X2 [Daucus carota subsp. sativus]
MTSAVLPRINEGQWRNYAHHGTGYNAINPNPNSGYGSAGIGRFVSQNPNPNPRYVQSVDRGHVRKGDVAAPRFSADVSPDCCVVEKETARDGHVIFHLDLYSRSELKELKNRLVSDLERVRSVMYEIKSRESEARLNRSFGPPSGQINNVVSNVKKGGSGKKSGPGKILGQKRGMQVSSNREIKRPVKNVVFDSTATRKVEAVMRRKCGAILSKLMKHKHGWVFNKPVDAVALGLHNYHQVIKRPMDLGTVKTKLGKHLYGTPADFAADVRLIFDNAMTYNPKGDDAHTMASILLDKFEELFVPAYNEFEAERQRIVVAQQNYSKPLPRLAEAQIVATQVKMEKPVQMHSQGAFTNVVPPVQASAAKVCNVAKKSLSVQQKMVPEAKPIVSNRREMSDGDREKLGLILQDLAGEYLNDILQIVAKRNSELASPGGDGEIELDVHALDSETMWDLEKFARLHKKAARNRMRKEELVNHLASNLENIKSPVATMEEPHVPTMLKVEEDIDIGDEIPMYDYPPVEIERDAPSPIRSSNSSSSSSGTDSSSGKGCSFLRFVVQFYSFLYFEEGF